MVDRLADIPGWGRHQNYFADFDSCRVSPQGTLFSAKIVFFIKANFGILSMQFEFFCFYNFAS